MSEGNQTSPEAEWAPYRSQGYSDPEIGKSSLLSLLVNFLTSFPSSPPKFSSQHLAFFSLFWDCISSSKSFGQISLSMTVLSCERPILGLLNFSCSFQTGFMV
jgi:hypothetical protein